MIVNYRGNQSYNPKYYYYYGVCYYYEYSDYYYYCINNAGEIRIQFKDSDGDNVSWSGSGSSPTWRKWGTNLLVGLSYVSAIGDKTAPFSNMSYFSYGGSAFNRQCFWSTFKSQNGDFLYFISDQYRGPNYMVGFNITPDDIEDRDGNTREPFEPFLVHDKKIGFEQIDTNSWNYESRFYAVPGSGIVLCIANDSSADKETCTNLEIYAFDADTGGEMEVISSDVTPGNTNSINHMYLSTNAETLVFQRCAWAGDYLGSATNRVTLQGNNDLCVVMNVKGVVERDEDPDAFVLSAGASHGHSVAFIGEGNSTRPTSLYFSSADSGTNGQWIKRTLKSAALVPGATIREEDDTESFYEVFAAGLLVPDNPHGSN